MNIDDCIAHCAVQFGGGAAAWYDLDLWGLLCWVDRAIQISEAENAAAG